MLPPEQLSSIGIGTYRMNASNTEHRMAFKHAIRSGCNLADTSTNYLNGQAEKLIGRFIREDNSGSARLFIVTKAGYIQGDLLKQLRDTPSKITYKAAISKVSETLDHCIHPDFLSGQIECSLNRLNRSYIDCLLLHNPEYYFKNTVSSVSKPAFYSRMKKAFEFLEEQVGKGLIRYYGVSSNTFPLPIKKDSTVNLRRLIEIAGDISSSHHFKFIQFPFNFYEQGVLEKQFGNYNLLELARNNQIITLGNRPLSSSDENGYLRFAEYPDIIIASKEEAQDVLRFEKLISIFNERIDKIEGGSVKANDFPIVNQLQQHFQRIGNEQAVYLLYNKLISDFVQPLFDYEIPENISNKIKTLREKSIKYARRNISHRAKKTRVRLINEKEISENDQRPFPNIACEAYLNKGLGHVLIGMRRKEYIDRLKPLFHYKTVTC